MGPCLVCMTAYRSGSTFVIIGPAGAPRRRSSRTLISSGVPRNSGRSLSLGTTYRMNVPGLLTRSNTSFRFTVFFPLTAAAAASLGSTRVSPSKSVITSRASPGGSTTTLRGWPGGTHIFAGDNTDASSIVNEASSCMGSSLLCGPRERGDNYANHEQVGGLYALPTAAKFYSPDGGGRYFSPTASSKPWCRGLIGPPRNSPRQR